MSKKEHWIKAYEARPAEELGWYQETPQPSIDLLAKTNLNKSARILNVGAGSSKFVDAMVIDGFENVMVNDLSPTALNQLKNRLGEYADKVQFIEDDLTKPDLLYKIPNVDLWHDRAVLHFFTDRKDQDAYFDLLKAKVKNGGFVILAEFSKEGAEKCCGLTLCRYDLQMLKDRLGEDFELIDSFDHTYINPRGEDRPYIYTLFKRINA